MKIRQSFVTNSSSSSFVIHLKDITMIQKKSIFYHSELGKELGIEYSEEAWSISIDDEHIYGETTMDNFCMEEFLEKIGVPRKAIEWDD